ncbi:MAG: hypothetical protein Q8N26_05430 [Myxococcales bacterium]|nr:hypothetical protein [Myxococcales bacterium]
MTASPSIAGEMGESRGEALTRRLHVACETPMSEVRPPKKTMPPSRLLYVGAENVALPALGLGMMRVHSVVAGSYVYASEMGPPLGVVTPP